MLFMQFDWLLSYGYPCTIHLQRKKLASHFIPVTDKHEESHNVLFSVWRYSLKIFLINKISKTFK